MRECLASFQERFKRRDITLWARLGNFIEYLGAWGLCVYMSVLRGCRFIAAAFASFGRWIRAGVFVRRIDWWAAFDAVGPRAVLIVSLISFLIGLILAFVGAAQLKLFGAQVYVASLVANCCNQNYGAQ